MEEKRVMAYPFFLNIYFKQLPILNTGNRIGPTGYIDYISKEEVTHAVMKGKDCYGRKFIVIKAIIDNKICIQTFFQRYADTIDLWMGGQVLGDCYNLLETIGGIKYKQANLIKDLVDGKTVKLLEEHNPCYYLYDSIINKNVVLYDEKRWNAAIIIQNNWNIFRYNPKYQLCRRKIDEKINNIIKVN